MKKEDQSFRALTKEEVKFKINTHQPLTWGLLLRNGEIVFGNFDPTTTSPGFHTEARKEFGALSKKELDSSISFHIPFRILYIPLDGLRSVFGVFSSRPFHGIITTEGKWVDWNSVESLMKAQYNIFVSHEVGYKVDSWVRLDQIKEISFQGPTVLYSDWEWFQSISGGINSIGIGMGPISASLGWDKSLSKTFWKKVRGSINKDQSELVIKGHVKVLRKTIEIEGEEWTRLDIATENDRMMALVKRRNFMFPIDYFNRIESLLTVYGEKVSFTGDSKPIALLKVRGIAFLGL